MPAPTSSPVGLGPGAFDTSPALACDSQRGFWALTGQGETLHKADSALC